MLPPIEPVVSALASTKRDTKRPVNQWALVAFLLAIAGWPVLLTSPKTGNYPILSVPFVVLAIILGHIGASSNNMSKDNSLAVRGLIVGYLLAASLITWAVLKYW